MMNYSLRLNDRLFDITRPQVMGIVNVTPDSFFDGSRTLTSDDVERRVASMIDDGADMIDIGGYSSRPGAGDVDVEEELRRIELGMKAVRRVDQHIPVSVDTFRSVVARRAIEQFGADIINDISGGTLDHEMFQTVADLRVPYILMHMRGTPADMQHHTDYVNPTADIIRDLSEKLATLRLLGVADVIIDPGFGFSKTPDQCFKLLKDLRLFEQMLNCPVLAGLSRKTMIWRTLDIDPQQSLNGTTCLNTIALMNGATILRVHDVLEAAQAVKLYQNYINN